MTTTLLNSFATKIVAENNFIKASFGGFAGSGKTRTASLFIIGAYKDLGCKNPILIIDNEKGSRFLIPLFKEAGIETYVKDTIELADILQAFELLKNNEISFLFIDSLTKVWYKFVNDYKVKNRVVFMTLQDWGKILPAWQEAFADKFVNLVGNCVFTGRGGYTYDMEEDEKTHKKQFVKSGVKMKMAGETPFEPDLNIWMELCQDMKDDGKPEVWREAMVMKDRSSLIDGKTFKNPTYTDFKPVVQYLVSVPKGEVAKASDTTNLAPKETYSDTKDQATILLEKIGGEFTKRQYSTGTADKALKLAIVEKCFGTTAWTEVEKMSVKQLETGHTRVIELLQHLDQFEGDKIAAVKTFEFSFFAQ